MGQTWKPKWKITTLPTPTQTAPHATSGQPVARDATPATPTVANPVAASAEAAGSPQAPPETTTAQAAADCQQVGSEPWAAALAAAGWPATVIADVRVIREHRPAGWLSANHPRIVAALPFGPTGYDAAYAARALHSLATTAAHEAADPCAAAYITFQPDGVTQVVYEDDRFLAAWLKQRYERERSEREHREKMEAKKAAWCRPAEQQS